MEINVAAAINQLGFGVVGLNTILSLEKIGRVPALWPIGGNVECAEECHPVIKKACDRTKHFNPMAPSLRIWHQWDLAQHVGSGTHGAIPYFERNKLYPHEIHHLQCQDVVLASSGWMKKVLEDHRISRVKLARPGVDRSIFKPVTKPNDRTDVTVFLAVGKWEVRKGHDVLVEVFNRAFTKNDKVALVMLTSNPFLSEQESNEWVSMYKNSPLGDKIQIVGPGRLPMQANVAHVMSQVDCGVFLSRAEGWNLDLAEMMSMGVHCIATDYSAHTEFCTPENSLLIHIDKTEQCYDGKWFHGFGEWAALDEPQIEQAVTHMWDIYRRKQEGRLGINHAGIDSMACYTWENFAHEIVEGLC